MKKLLNLRSAIGLSCILYALVLLYKPSQDRINFNILDLEKPNQEILSIVQPIARLVSDKNDKAKLAVFNQEFGNRVPSYDADAQQINDLYVSAAACFFQDSINDKYSGLDDGILGLMKIIMSDDNAKLTDQQKMQMSKHFLGFSWSLTQE